MDQVENAVIAGCQVARGLTGLGYLEDQIREIRQTWYRAGQFATFAACLMNLERCFFGVLQLDLSPEDGFKVKFHEFGGSSLVYEIMARSSGDPSWKDFHQHLPNMNPVSEESFLRVKNWMDTCHRDHALCSPHPGQAMPKRLIAISQNGLRLLETNAKRQEYAALSYKWGGPQQMQATNDSLHSLMNGFRIEDLPNSLRDAVTLTQKLGLSYLWIDALCVIQDNDVDKAIEVSRMATIYENAAVTIASSRTNGAQESFLSSRSTFDGRHFGNDSKHELFGFNYHCRDGQSGSIVLMHKYTPKLYDQEPLDQRGWAFQERLLSPRIVDYRSEQTKWTCRTSQGQTGFTDGWLNRSIGYRDQDLLRQSQDTIRPSNLPSNTRIRNARYQWYEILTLYTSRDITRPGDRLPAVSAIAQRYAEVLGAEYMAGLWKSWLGEELLWKQPRNSPRSLRPKEYQGPSWSWAGIDAPIEIKLLSSSERWATISSPDSSVRGLHNIPQMGNFQSGDAFELIDYSVEPLIENSEYGEVRPARLTVRGKLRPAKISATWGVEEKGWLSRTLFPNPQTSRNWWSRLIDQNPSNVEMLALDVYLDCPQDDFRKYGHPREHPYCPDMEVSLLLVGHYDATHCGLILVQESSGEYFRVGVFFSSSCRDPDAFPDDNDEEWETRKRKQISWLFSSDFRRLIIV